MERKKVCSIMDCQKLSREACAHAAQNDRLPVQTVVQVLYYEQQRFREVMNSDDGDNSFPFIPNTTTNNSNNNKRLSLNYTTDRPRLVSDKMAALRRENEDLKVELVKMKTRLKEMERLASKPSFYVSSPTDSTNSISSYSGKPPLPRKSLMNSVSKKLGKLNPFVRGNGMTPNAKAWTKASRDRRHSIS